MDLHSYEKLQNFNAITRLLHANRYRILKRIAGGLAPADGETLRVLDIGCGPATAFPALTALRDDVDYTGIDIRQDFCDLATSRYGDAPNFRVHCTSIADRLDLLDRCDLILALESFEHIPEPTVVRVVEAIGASDFQALYVTVPNEIGPAIALKNIASLLMGYVRHREYTWAETFHAARYDLDRVGPHGVGHKGFDWRWLAQTLRQNVKIVRRFTSPVQIVPTAVSPSVGFLCEKRGQAPGP